jgi:hypothetical protein
MSEGKAWGPMVLLAIAAAYALAQWLPVPLAASAAPAGYRWVTCANTALAGAAAVYLAHYWLGEERVGQAASVLAALGAIGVPLGLLADAAQAAPLRGAGSSFGLYEGTALFSAAAVFLYLAMEHVYRSRAAAMLIMPAVLLAVLCEMWLVAQGAAAPGRPVPPLSGYWVLGQRFAACLGYGAVAAAAGCSVLVLLRDARDAVAPGVQSKVIIGAAAVGAPLLLIGTGMGVVWSFSGDSGGALSGIGSSLPAVIATLALLAWVRLRRPGARSLAWFAVAAFAVSASGLLMGAWSGEALG